jgi:hypothetical protein
MARAHTTFVLIRRDASSFSRKSGIPDSAAGSIGLFTMASFFPRIASSSCGFYPEQARGEIFSREVVSWAKKEKVSPLKKTAGELAHPRDEIWQVTCYTIQTKPITGLSIELGDMSSCCWCGDGVTDVLSNIESTLGPESGKNGGDDDKETVVSDGKVYEAAAHTPTSTELTTDQTASAPAMQLLSKVQRGRERSLTIDATTTTSADATITTPPGRVPDEVPFPRPSAIDSCESLFKDTVD